MNESTAKTTASSDSLSRAPTSPENTSRASASLEALRQDPFVGEIEEIFADFFEGFGFRANLGRLWALLFYSADPLSQRDLMQLLDLSAGMVSQGLQELSRFGMVQSVSLPGERALLYQPERNLIRIVSSILGRREEQIIERLKERIEELKVQLAVSAQEPRLVKLRLQGMEEVLVICNLALAIITLVEMFSHYSYHAVSLGVHALRHIRVAELPRWLKGRSSTG